MKKFVLSAVLTMIAFAIPAAAQVEDGHAHPDVPQDKVVEAAKPLLGEWNGVVCQPKPYGVRFSVRLDTVKDETGKDNVTPIFHLVAVQVMDIGEPFDFIPVSFKEYGDRVALVVTNNQLEVALLTNETAGLDLGVEDNDGGFSSGFAEKGDDVKDPWAYVEKLAKSCPAPAAEKNNTAQVAQR